MRRVLLVGLAVTLVSASMAVALDISGNALLWTVKMDQVNLLLLDYNQTTEAQIPKLSLAWGGEVSLGVPMFTAFDIFVGMRSLFCSSTAERDKVSSLLLGACFGTSYRLGRLSIAADIGAYRAGFSFPAAGYEDLFGWAMGFTGRAAYKLSLGPVFQVTVGLSAQWLPVNELEDSTGGSYALREGAFLDYTGIGVVFGITWARP
jgi:hypothetical protein